MVLDKTSEKRELEVSGTIVYSLALLTKAWSEPSCAIRSAVGMDRSLLLLDESVYRVRVGFGVDQHLIGDFLGVYCR